VNEEATRTPLDAVQRKLGAEFVVGGGWFWAKNFGDARAEYDAVRNHVGIWDASPHQKWEFRGRGSLAALDRIFTRDLSRMEVGRVCYGPFCDDQGKMLGDATVFRFAADLAHFERVVEGLDVTIEKRTLELPQLGINGPGSRALLGPLCDRDLSGLRYYHFMPEQVGVGGIRCWLSRSGYSGELGYELFCSPDDAERLWNLLTAAGARPYGLDAIEWIRIESGLIAMGADFFPGQTSPYDMSLDRFVDFSKPSFAGKDRLEAEANDPPNQLVTLEIEGGPPPAGAAVLRGDARCGTVTSPCVSPVLGRSLALAVVRRDSLRAGSVLQVAMPGEALEATIRPLSIIDPEKKRPRV
jgi:aminomethyltransferase